jgi:shikimate kinase
LQQPIETAKTALHASMRLFSDYHPVFKNKIWKAANCFRLTPRRYIGHLVMAEHHEQIKCKFGMQAALVIDRPVVLVGMMGVGKTSIGKRLAGRLDVPFADADDEIEKAAGLSITEIFAKFGEEYFRDGERRVIARLIEGEPKVIATGGGAFVNDDTRALILERATSIWLDADVQVLADRVSRRDHRPLLKGKDPVTILTDLGKVRNPIYAAANLHIRSDSSPHVRTVEDILKALSA